MDTKPRVEAQTKAPVEISANGHGANSPMPGARLKSGNMPGHWLLARLGKRVLRPGGIEMTRALLDALDVSREDAVVEFAPGLGVTTALTVARAPRAYTAIERDAAAAAHVGKLLTKPEHRCFVGSADQTALPSGSATVVYGEAMLSMQTAPQKQRIMGEAARVLRAGGRYGIHELCLRPDDLPQETKDGILKELTEAVHVGVRPLTAAEWTDALEAQGFTVRQCRTMPFHLLEPRRIVNDEGLCGALRFASRVLRDHEARKRVLAMRKVFRRYREHLGAVMLVAEKAG